MKIWEMRKGNCKEKRKQIMEAIDKYVDLDMFSQWTKIFIAKGPLFIKILRPKILSKF